MQLAENSTSSISNDVPTITLILDSCVISPTLGQLLACT